jgi:hypothetical protein
MIDTYMKRHLTKAEQDALNERLPVLTESKSKTVKQHETHSYDRIWDFWEKEESHRD